MEPVVRVADIDHLVLIVADAERSLRFYCEKLGCAPYRVDRWRSGEIRFPSARVNEHLILDLFEGSRGETNLDHFCLLVEPTDFAALRADPEITIVRDLGERSGAQGDGNSLYVNDPDGNVVELRYYGPVIAR